MKLLPAVTWKLAGPAGADVDARLIPLLEAIAATGSLAAAVTEQGQSYRAGWGLLRDWQRELGVQLVELERGRGARLAAAGVRLLEAHRTAQRRLAPTLAELAVTLGEAKTMPRRAGRRALLVAASHDLALAALRELLPAETGTKIELSVMGSLHALEQFAAGRVVIAGFHVAQDAHEPLAIAPFRRWLSARRDRLIRFVDREQGLILPRGNPARVRGFKDLVRLRLRFANRQSGSGTRILIERCLAEAGVAASALPGFAREELTHSAVAATVASGAADAGFGLRAVAAEAGLAFVPLVRERYYLAVRAADLDAAAVATLLEYLRGPAFAALVRSLPGYSGAQAGSVSGIELLGSR
ncbi:MAG: substrate-binding domain-containing protein [Casimicrobiaceae bacterium]